MSRAAVIIGSAVTVAGVGALVWYFWPRKGSVEIGDLEPSDSGDNVGTVGNMGSTSGVRGIRNNNPGNIRKSSDSWVGLAPSQLDPAFFQFTHAKYGVRALAKILRNYQAKYGLRTITGLINRWAPPAENNTSAYVNYVAGFVGVGAQQTINVEDYLPLIVEAIIFHENGQVPYSKADIAEWINLP